MYHITFNETENIFYADAKAEIGYADIKKLIQHFSGKSSELKQVFIVLDYSNSDFTFDDTFIIHTISEIKDLVDNLLKTFENVYAAHIVKNQSRSDILANLFAKQKFENKHFHIKIFNDRQAGKEWLIDMRKQFL